MRALKVCATDGRQWPAVGDAPAASSSDSTERASSPLRAPTRPPALLLVRSRFSRLFRPTVVSPLDVRFAETSPKQTALVCGPQHRTDVRIPVAGTPASSTVQRPLGTQWALDPRPHPPITPTRRIPGSERWPPTPGPALSHVSESISGSSNGRPSLQATNSPREPWQFDRRREPRPRAAVDPPGPVGCSAGGTVGR